MRMFDRTVVALIDRLRIFVQMRSDAAVSLANIQLPAPEDQTVLGWDGPDGTLRNYVINDGSVLPTLLGSLSDDEITQLLAIGSTTISAAQWG